MHHVLVADDEPRHRRGIADMVKMLRPDYRVFMAKDGEEAFKIIESNHIDILLTDIRMPNMDGLQLIEKLGARTESLKVVILSVYGHFDYARQAIKLGAFDYMLKPLEQKDMEDMLLKLDEAIAKQQSHFRAGELVKQKLSSAIPVYEQHLLTRWMRAEVSEEELHEIMSSFPNQHKGFVVLAQFDHGQIRHFYTPDEFEEVKRSFKDWISQSLQALGQSISFFLEGMEPILASVITPTQSLEWLLKKDMERLTQFIEQVGIEFELTVSVGIGGYAADLYHEAHRSFVQAQHALDYAFYYGRGKLVFYDDIAYDPFKPALMLPSDNGITAALNGLDREQAVAALQQLLERLMQGSYPSPAHLKDSMLYMLLTQIKANEAMLRNEEASNLIAEMEFQIPACTTLQELKDKSALYLHRIIASIESRKNNKNQRIIELCMAYLAEHYMEDLSLEVVAKRFFFSPAYFSSFFKSHTSMTFTEYLLRLRIDHAIAQLQDGDKKISEIALSVGFRDAGYFTRIFKRETGMSPEEYRKNAML